MDIQVIVYLLTHLPLLITGQMSMNSITLRVLGDFRNRMASEIGPFARCFFLLTLSTYWSPIYSVTQSSLSIQSQTSPLHLPNKMVFLRLAVIPFTKLLGGPIPLDTIPSTGLFSLQLP